MAIRLITYDLKDKNADYGPLLDYIRLHDSTKLSESSYAIDTGKTPSQIYAEVQSLLGDQDYFLVMTLQGPWVGQNSKTTIEWLKRRLPVDGQ